MKYFYGRWNVILFSILSLLLSTKISAQEKWNSEFIHINKNGSLQYIPDAKGNIIPDFSLVGYHHSQKNIPDIPVIKIVEPVEENAQQAIQSAINEMAIKVPSANGFRGTVLLKAGVYKIPGTIKITASGIVLRGEGDATKLIATGKGQRNLISVSGTGSIKEVVGSRKKITDKYVQVGTKSFTINNVDGLKIGDRIIVFRPGTMKWIEDLKMNQIEPGVNTKQWEPKEYDMQFEREITAIDGNKIFIDNPVVMAMEEQYGGGEIYKYNFDGRISEVGIENLYCESEYNGNEDEDHGWVAVHFNNIENGWVRNVTSKYFGYSCVSLAQQSKNTTVTKCNSLQPKSQIIGGRRYSFNNDGQQNLFTECFASEGRHDYVTGAKVCGPNVFYNCKAEKANADIGPHHRWAMGTLYDNIISDGEINCQDRGNWGTGHGWSGANQVFWNCAASKSAIQNPWVSAKNYVIGMQAIKYDGRLKGRPDANWEGLNKKGLMPSSLYLMQLQQNNSTK